VRGLQEVAAAQCDRIPAEVTAPRRLPCLEAKLRIDMGVEFGRRPGGLVSNAGVLRTFSVGIRRHSDLGWPQISSAVIKFRSYRAAKYSEFAWFRATANQDIEGIFLPGSQSPTTRSKLLSWLVGICLQIIGVNLHILGHVHSQVYSSSRDLLFRLVVNKAPFRLVSLGRERLRHLQSRLPRRCPQGRSSEAGRMHC